ncbi:MFS transporter [Thermomicrobium sp. 4228-Ro]|uniref:MFS transporter n=1 Tax=Thermomicrobium sp. 4228-Ro TaxID=2993937 RepID=UPI00224938AC|nr:MFS transporter [Thermomicrobium sp. 4228-Ro]MCX2726690.1 MFS transporter [Thermomicrobium sp. 4228-Ro]
MSRARTARLPLLHIASWYRKYRVLVWISTIVGINQLGFGSIVPVVPLYAQAFGVSEALVGLAIAVYGLARFTSSAPAGWLADRSGRRWSLFLGGMLTAFGNLICALAPTYGVFLLGRFVSGSGASMVLTAGQIVLADITEPATRGRTMALYQTVFLFGVGFGPIPGGLLAQYGGLGTPFWVYAGVGTLVAFLALWRLPETRPADAVTAREREFVFGQQLLRVLRHRPLVLISMVTFGNFFARTGALFTLVPLRAEREIGLSPSQIGFGLAAVSIVSLVMAYPAGVLVDTFGRKIVIAPATLFSGLGLIGFAFAPSYFWFLVACVVWAMASGIGGGAPAAYAADAAPPGMTAAALSAYRMLSEFGYVVGPTLLGLAAEFLGIRPTLIMTAIGIVSLGALFWLAAPETYQRRRSVREWEHSEAISRRD